MNIMRILIWSALSSIFAMILTACSSAPTSESAAQTAAEMQSDTEISKANFPSAASRTAGQLNSSNILNEQRLGTQWGDEISSTVTEVDLKRLSASPIAETQIRYAAKTFTGRSINSISMAAGKVNFSVTDERGRGLALHSEGQRYYLTAHEGQSYMLKFSNSSAQTFEVVASVDGLDVINGQRASRYHSGYVLRPYSSLSIEGFRKSSNAVASFIFSRPKDAYANHSASGSIYNTGVIGAAVYELRAPQGTVRPSTPYAPAPNAFPAD